MIAAIEGGVFVESMIVDRMVLWIMTRGSDGLLPVGSEDFGETLNRHGETLNRHGETGNGPDADDEHFPTTEKKGSLSYADAARGTKRYVTFE